MAETAGLTLPPHNLEAEEAVIGSVLIDPESFFDVAQFLHGDDFYLVKHRWIWDAFTALHDHRTPIDLLTVQQELDRLNQLAEIGGPAYLTRLVTLTPTAFNASAYGRLVEEAATRRRLINAASDIARLAYDEGSDINTVIGESEKALFGVSESRNLHELKPMRKAASEYYDRIQYLYDHRGEFSGVPTGYADLDKLLGGMQASDLLILAGRPGRGKTSLLLSIALHAAKIRKKHIAIFSLEMSTEQLVQRLVSQETQIDSQRLRLGDLKDDEWRRLTEAIKVLSETGIYLDDTPSISALQLRTKCRRLNSEIRLDMVVVDYLQLMTGDLRVENRAQEVSHISRSLKALARELNVPVLTAAQLSRAVEQRKGQQPMLSDLRESGCLTGDSLVYLPDRGCSVPIRDLEGRTGFKVLALSPQTWKLETATGSKAFCTGVKPVFRLATRSGRTIRATANHPFLTVQGWKRLDELATETHIARPRQLPGSTQPTLGEAGSGRLGMTTRQMQAPLARAYCGTASDRQHASRERAAWAQPMAEIVEADSIARLSERDVVWDSVVAIEPNGEEKTYDLTVEGLHNFVANGVVVHNSIEQDADVVMFLHHPDDWNNDPVQKNITQLIVAKHRHGPTRDIDLVFLESQTRFVDAERRNIPLNE